MKHWSDCAVHSEPAYPAGECDCGGYTPEYDIIDLAKQAGFYAAQPMYYDEEMLGRFFRLAYARGMLKAEAQMKESK